LKLGKKRRESSKRNYYIISPRVIIKAIINILTKGCMPTIAFKLLPDHVYISQICLRIVLAYNLIR